MKFRVLFLSSLALVLIGLPASAATKWTAATTPTLLAQSDEAESDRSLFAVCGQGVAELFVGANDMVGKGEGEAVSLRLESGGKTATISGISRRSPNHEMTGGTELVGYAHPQDDVFKVLATGKPVKLSGSLEKPVTWNDRGMANAVKKFVKECSR